ncbi:MAG TPA: tetratricopeptide repeat protein [Acidobacteriaceae bacterium]|nr:tetratricopeptide repeat protein [Acidobacteriaceae bacterium]
MTTQSIRVQQSIAFGEGFELDLRPRRLRHGRYVLKLERIPLEVLFLLVERSGEIVTREQIVATVWGEGVFLDTDNSIRGAIRKIRQALKDDPEQPRFIQTLTGRGYRFIAPVVATGLPPEEPDVEALAAPVKIFGGDTERNRTAVQAQDAEEVHGRKHPQSARSWRFIAVAVLCVSFVALLGVWRWRVAHTMPSATDHKTVLAVLPFDNLSGDADQEFFSDGLTEEMITQIGRLHRDDLVVVARNSIAKYKGTKLTAREIGKELNADYLVQGSVQRWSDRVRVRVELIDSRKQTDVWTGSYDRDLEDILAVQDSVVSSIADEIHIALTPEQKTRLANSRQTAPDAYVAYLKGRYYWNRRTGESIGKAEQYFQQAIESDPSFAAAYSGLADCNSGLAWHGFKAPADALPKAEVAARKAIEIDPQSAEAHASLGLVLSHRWKWEEAENEFRRALELDPHYANAHHWYGDLLSIKGRHEEAVSEARRALELDPLNLMISTWVGQRYYLKHDYAAAIAQNRDSVELSPDFAAAHLLLGEDYVQAGLHNEAVNELKTAANLSGNSPLYTAQVGVALAASGRKIEALRLARELETNSKKRYVSPYGVAQIYATLHNDRETFRWLQAACDDHAVWNSYLAVDPVFDDYRSDARFRELLRCVNLP